MPRGSSRRYPAATSPAAPAVRVFGEPYRSGQPLTFNREVPWYIIEAVRPEERPESRWSVVNHAAGQPSVQLQAFPGTPSSACITTADGKRIGLSVARAVRGSEVKGDWSWTARTSNAALGANTATNGSPGHRLGTKYVPSDSGSDCTDDCEAAPGPGHYNVPSRITEGPAFSMGAKAVRSAWLPRTDPDGLPGPGEYIGPDRWARSGPAYTMTFRPKPANQPDVPGPGAYESHKAVPTGPAFSIKGLHSAVIKSGPGPGEYTVQRIFDHAASDGPAFSILGRPRAAEPAGADDPGPAAYQESLSKPQGPAFSFGGKAVEVKSLPTPGPGDVSMPDAWRAGGRGFTFAGRPAEKEEDGTLPGPGEYDVHRGASQGPAFTMAGRSLPNVESTPGPAEYDALSSKMAQMSPGPAYTIQGRAKSAFDVKAGGPGPGAYHHPESVGQDGAAFSIGERLREQPGRGATPGPGDYDTSPHSREGPAFTMAGRPNGSPTPEEAPGPGAYEAQGTAAGPAFTMGAKAQAAKGKPSDQPGVGEYTLLEAWNEGPAYTIGERVQERVRDGPGPGEYHLAAGVPEGPKFTIAGRRPAARADDGRPGPGHYNAKLPSDGGPAFTLGGRLAAGDPETAEYPGPGHYLRSEEAPRGPAFTMGAHVREPDPGNNLGPGEYSVGPAGPGGPAYTMGEKILVVDERADLPGPGEYNSTHTRDGPAFSMAGKARGRNPDSDLGPGQYLGNATAKEGPMITFGMRHRELEPDIDVGPGQYDSLAVPSGPAASIGTSRRQEVVDPSKLDLPGPGAYTPQTGKDDGPAYTMAARPRELPPEGPGPGAYNLQASHSGPSFSILGKAGTQFAEREAAERPGPGAYQVPSRITEGPAHTLGALLQPMDDDAHFRPGPGHYNVREENSGVAYTIAPRVPEPQAAHALKEAGAMPAPGDYGIGVRDSPTGVSFTIKGRIKDPTPPPAPAPGEYHGLHAAPSRPEGPSYTMGGKITRKKICAKKVRRRREQAQAGAVVAMSVTTDDATPGPFDYSKEARSTGPAFSIGNRSDGIKPRATPAPGSYSVRPLQEGSKPSMGHRLVHGSPWADALRRARENAPGPGSYDDVKPFPRPLGAIVTSLMKQRPSTPQ